MTQTLSEEQVIDGFHSFLQTALAQAKAEKLLDADTLASAEADLMIAGPALSLFFGALRSNTDPPSVPIPRPRDRRDGSQPALRLSRETCPPAFARFVQVWASTVPTIQALPSSAQHDLSRIICGLPPISQPPHASINRIAADLRAVAIEISQRRTFQERYQADLQAALDAGIGGGRRPRQVLTSHFVPPPMYEDKDMGKDSKDMGTDSKDMGVFPSPGPGSQELSETPPPVPPKSPDSTAAAAADPAISLIRETLFASLADVIARTPALRSALRSDPPRAYFSCVALAILDVTLSAVTASGAVRTVLGRELTVDSCPTPLRPLMLELGGIAREACRYAEEDDEVAMRLAAQGKDVPEPRMDRIRKTLASGVGYDERERRRSAEESGRRSTEGRAQQFANRVNVLALSMTQLPAFKTYVKDVFEVLGAVR